jgi:hypothetical protein
MTRHLIQNATSQQIIIYTFPEHTIQITDQPKTSSALAHATTGFALKTHWFKQTSEARSNNKQQANGLLHIRKYLGNLM